jgi:hypothetical protein
VAAVEADLGLAIPDLVADVEPPPTVLGDGDHGGKAQLQFLGPIVLRAGYGRFAGQGAGAAAEEWQRYGDFLAGISFEEFPNFLRSVGALMNWGSAAEVERQLSTELLVQGLRALPRGQQ